MSWAFLEHAYHKSISRPVIYTLLASLTILVAATLSLTVELIESASKEIVLVLVQVFIYPKHIYQGHPLNKSLKIKKTLLSLSLKSGMDTLNLRALAGVDSRSCLGLLCGVIETTPNILS